MTIPTTGLRHTAQPPTIAFEACGRGDPVLFLHGIGGNRTNWAGQLQRYGQEFQAIALDFRGYGDSGALAPDFAFADFADDVRQVLDTLGIARAHVVGLSMGGLVAQAFYARAPERVASLSLVACRSGADPVPQGERREDFVQSRLGPLRAGGPEALAQSLAPKLIGRYSSLAARQQVMDSLRRLRPEAYLQIMEARMRIAPLLDLATVRVPVLVVGSDEDQVAPLPQMRALADAIPQATLAVVERAGHLINIEQPEAFDDAVLPFLRAASGRASGV